MHFKPFPFVFSLTAIVAATAFACTAHADLEAPVSTSHLVPANFSKAKKAGWKLVWSDEFNEPTQQPNPKKWDYEVGKVRNHELQYYTKDRRQNARIENGNLVIETRKESYKGSHITSASLITDGKASWKYGLIEVRAKLPKGRGTWPAIWMLGTNHKTAGWPKCGEIDIMEAVGWRPNLIFGTIHRPGRDKGGKVRISDPYTHFHVYGLEWSKDAMKFSVDGHVYFTYPIVDGTPDAKIFRKPFYLILNAAFGGSWGGRKGVDEKILPTKYLIDYVRIYQPAKPHTKH